MEKAKSVYYWTLLKLLNLNKNVAQEALIKFYFGNFEQYMSDKLWLITNKQSQHLQEYQIKRNRVKEINMKLKLGVNG